MDARPPLDLDEFEASISSGSGSRSGSSGLGYSISTLLICLVVAMSMMYAMLHEAPTSSPRKSLLSKLANIIRGAGGGRDETPDPQQESIDSMMKSITIKDALAQLTTSINKDEALLVLKVLKLKLSDKITENGKKFALDACEKGLLKHTFSMLKNVTPTDERFSLSLDVIYQVLMYDESLQFIESSGGPDMVKDIIDNAILVIKDATSASKLEVQPDIREITADETLESIELEDKIIFSSASLTNIVSIMKSVTILAKLSQYGNEKYQRLLSDRGAVDTVLSCLKLSVRNRIAKERREIDVGLSARPASFVTPELLKIFDSFGRHSQRLTVMCFQVVISLINGNPANRRDFVSKDESINLRITLECLERLKNSPYMNNDEAGKVFLCGLSVIYLIIKRDPKNSGFYNEHKVKQWFMQHDLHGFLDFARKTYPKNEALANMMKAIYSEYTQDYA